MLELQELTRRYRKAVELWIPVRKMTIIVFIHVRNIAEKLREYHKKVNITRIAGSSASIGGAILAIIGFGIAPVTFGASLGLSIAGIGVAVAGGATAAGASIVDTVTQKANVKEAQEIVRRDYDQLEAIRKIADQIEKTIDEMRKKCPNISHSQFAGMISAVVSHTFIRGSNLVIRLTELGLYTGLEVGAAVLRVGGAAAKSVAAVGIAFNIILIPLDLFEIVRSSINLAKNSETDAVRKLNKIADDLEKQKEEIKEQAQI